MINGAKTELFNNDNKKNKFDLEKSNKELRDLLQMDHSTGCKPTSDEFARIKELLKIGAKPPKSEFVSRKRVFLNDYEETQGDPSPFTKAVKSSDLDLVELLIQYNIEPTEDLLISSSGLLEKELHNHSIPLQNQIYEKLIQSIKGKQEEELLKLICDEYQKILNAILEAKKSAQNENKPLMVLVGETHQGLQGINSLLVELIVLYICFEELQIHKVMREAFNPKENVEGSWHPSFDIYQLINLKANIIEIDQGVQTLIDDDPRSEKGLKIRNNVMSEISIKENPHREDVVSIVGSTHLKGLKKETNLSDYYHILAINSSSHVYNPNNDWFSQFSFKDKEYRDACGSYKKNSDEVFQSQIINKNKYFFITPKMASNLAKKIHDQMHLMSETPKIVEPIEIQNQVDFNAVHSTNEMPKAKRKHEDDDNRMCKRNKL